jgi:DNA-binding CsgD family transcriptional regulator
MLVGRKQELAATLAVCQSAADGRGGVLLVTGEPGIGKTALLDCVGAADGTRLVLRATCVESESKVAFAAVQSLLWPLRDGVDQLESGQARLLRGVLDLGPPGGATSFTVGAATLALLSVASRDQPVVAVVDDAQWADVPSQEVLCFVGRRLEHEHMALLAGIRDGEPCLLTADRAFQRLELGGLETDAACSLLGRSAKEQLAPDVAARLLEACDGNPLGLVELPRLLTEPQRSGREPLPEALEAGPLVQRAFAARVADLGDDAADALLLLASAGEAESALVAMDTTVRSALERAEAAALVTRRAQIAFRHPLMRAAIYGAATPAARRSAHRRLAAVVDGAARRAWHLAEAADGPDEDVAEALEASAVEARAAGGVAAEAQALERAAELSAEPDRRALRLLGAARAWRRAGRIEYANEILTRALSLAEAERSRAEIQLERGYNLLRARKHRDAYEVLLAEARRVEADEPDLAARLYAAVALVANVYEEAPPALEPAERALELAGESGDGIQLEALFAWVTARMGRPRPPDEHDVRLVTRAAQLLEQPELRGAEQPHWIAYALAELERDEQARRLSDVALAEARAAGDVWSLCYGLYARAALELVSGRVDVALSWSAEAVPLAEQIGERWRLDQARVVRAEVEAARGNFMPPSEPDGEEPPEQLQLDDELNLGRALLAQSEPDKAIPHLERAERAFREQQPRAWYRLVPLDLAEAYAGARRPSDADAVLRGAAPAISGGPLVRPRARLARVRGLLAPEAKIDATFAQALALLDDVPQHLERARTELNWGERLRGAGREIDAVPHLEHALARFEALGADGWAARTRSELEAATGARRPTQPRRTDVLTAQELRVSQHAAAGLRDREIAALLYLSPRTVESYLHSAYRKLDVSNRTQLAGVLASDGITPIAGPVAQVP